MPELKDLLAAVVTLLATFTGAWAAFAFERSRRQDEEETRNVGAANRALYTLFNLWNVLEQFRKSVIEPHRGKRDAWLNLAATLPTQSGVATFQAGELAFLLQTPHAPVYATCVRCPDPGSRYALNLATNNAAMAPRFDLEASVLVIRQQSATSGPWDVRPKAAARSHLAQLKGIERARDRSGYL